MQMTLYFAVCHFSCPDLVFKALLRQPPDGFIMDGLAMITISVIFGLLTLRAWVRMLQFSKRQFIQQLILRELHIYRTKHRQLDWCKQAETSLIRLAAHTTSDSLGDESMLSFDTDSSFWVCDNAATGHICRDKSLFYGDLVPSIYEVSSANGIDSPTLMGTVILRLGDNAGIMHEFRLTHVNYMPNSPVNFFSLSRLAEHYSNSDGTPDQDGTGINSSYDSHTLYWSKKQFSKTFHTAASGLPVCLFSSGYSRLSAFATHLSKYYNNTVHWAFSSKVKDTELASNDDGDVIVTVDSEGGISFEMPASVNDAISFMRCMKLHYNDGNGIRDIVTFLGIYYVNDMQMVCHIQ